MYVPRAVPPRFANLFIACFLAAQVVVPLRYYLGTAKYDERFSWRMFSAVRVMKCASEYRETRAGTETRLALSSLIHEAWITNIRRGRSRVIAAFLERRCGEDGVTGARIVNQCVDANGARVAPREWSMDCATGEVREPPPPRPPEGAAP